MRNARPRRATRRGSGLLAGLLTAALGAGLLVVAPTSAHAAGNSLYLPGGGDHVDLGANAALYIDGTITYDDHCAWDGEGGVDDFFYPATNVYIVPAGSVGLGDALHDVAGPYPNTVIGVGEGAFIGELIGVVTPTGMLGDGDYDIVYDTCQDGTFSESDEIFSDAITVDVPDGQVPPVDPSIRMLKDKARQEYADWLKMHIGLTAILKIGSAKSILACLTNPTDACLGLILEGIYGPKHILAQANGRVTSQALALVANQAAHFGAIWQDPADPDFDHLPVVEPRGYEPLTEVGRPVPDAFVRMQPSLQQEEALTAALLHALERYQGAQAKGDAEWALVQARAVRDLSTALDEQLANDTAVADLRAAVAGDIDALQADLTDGALFVQRVRSSGFTAAEHRALRNRGQSVADIRSLEDSFVAGGAVSPLTKAQLLAMFDDVLQADAGMRQALQDSASGWDELVTQLEDRVDETHPTADAGGPYTAQGGTVQLDATASHPSPAAALVRGYGWDLDGDGDYDDATGATPTVHVDSSRTVTLHVTDDNGRSANDLARITIRGGDRAPHVTTATPATATTVTVGTPRTFGVTAADPDGDALTYHWSIGDDELPGVTGPTFGYDPTAAEVGEHVLSVTVRGAGTAVSHSWSVSVLQPDADSDGWTAGPDCDDANAVVHPGGLELPGNGVDDDCDAGSPDAPVGGVTGSLWTWGAASGTGQNTFTDQLSPKLVDLGQPVRAVETAHVEGYAVLQDRTVRAWGENFDGSVGDGTQTTRRSPVTVPGLTGVQEIATDGSSVLALRTNGTVVAWGSNLNQQLGDGSTVTSRLSPVDVLAPDGSPLSGITSVEAGESTSYAVTSAGQVRNWGVVHCDGTAPVEQTTRTNHADINPLFGTGVVQIASGDGGGALARKADGSVWSCNSYTPLNGRPGTNNAAVTPARIPGLSGIVDVAMGDSAAVALDEHGDVWLWGRNLNNTLDVLGLAAGAEQLTPVKVPLPAGPPVVDVETDYSATTFATRADGSVLVWGDNNHGSAGVGKPDYAIVGTPQVALGGGRAIATAGSDWNGLAIVRPAEDPAYERPAQYLSATVADATIGEATGGAATLTLSAPAPYALEVGYRLGNGPRRTVIVDKGATGAALPVSVTDDALDEDDEQLPLQVVSVSHSVQVAGGAAVVTVADDDEPPAASVGSVQVGEGSTSLTDVSVPVTLSGPSGKDVEVSWTAVDGTATSPADYAMAHGVAMVPAGQTSTVLHLSVVGDSVVEPDEELSVALSAPVDAALGAGSGTVTLQDDDVLPLSVSDAAVTEGSGPAGTTTPMTFTVSTPTLPDGESVEVPYEVVGGTAEVGPDVVASSGTVELTAEHPSRQVTVQVVADRVAEAVHQETFRLVLGRDLTTSARRPVVADGDGTGRVTDDDVTASVDAGPDVTGTEGSAVAISGTASAPATWSVDDAACTVADPSALSTTVLCNDQATATLTLTADDGSNPVVSDTATLTVTNVAPTVTLPASSTVEAGTPWSVTGSFTDPGSDSFTATADLADGAGTQPLTLSGKGFTLATTFATTGTKQVKVEVCDGTVCSPATTTVTVTAVPTPPSSWPWDGFYAPVDNLPVVNVVKAGSTVPLKFSVGGYRGTAVFAAGFPASGAHSCSSTVPTDQLESTANPGDSELSYDASSGRYQYNWKTVKSWAGQCRTLTLTMADGSIHTAEFRLK
jgi:alpha-tubulin suppressor-like RCC1 family protein